MFDVRPTENLEEFQRALLAIGQYFGAEPTPERAEKFSQSLPFERMHAALRGRAIVGGAGVFPFEMAVPGGIVRCAGVTVVGVYPTHRRRGVLRAMMRAQLDDIHERGEPIAALWASEETIYGRFGYGMASLRGRDLARTRALRVRAPVRAARTRAPARAEPRRSSCSRRSGSVRFSRRPGCSGASARGGRTGSCTIRRSAARAAARSASRCSSSTASRRPTRSTGTTRSGTRARRRRELGVVEAIGATPRGDRGDLALPARHRLAGDDQRRPAADRPPALLPARQAATDEVPARRRDLGAARRRRRGARRPARTRTTAKSCSRSRDAFAPWNEGRWKLAGGSCERTDDDADLRCDVTALGSVYLGGFTFAELARGLRVRGAREGAIDRADSIFRRTGVAPWCPEIF